jgi:cytochrome P450
MATHRPVSYDAENEIWHFAGYEAVRGFLKDFPKWSTAKRLDRVPPEDRVARLLTSDPPLHVKLRQYFSHAYRPRRVAALEERVRGVCRELLDSCLEKKRFDVTSEFAAPMTAIMISDLIGTSDELRQQFQRASSEAAGRGTLGIIDDDKPVLYMGGTPSAESQRNESVYAELIAERRSCPADDLVSDLARIPADELEQRIDVGALLNEQLGAGQSTTTHLLGSALYLLDAHPDQQELLRARPELIGSAVEETVRVSCPLQARPRLAAHRFAIAPGEYVPEGATGLGWLQAANVDPTEFQNPLLYDVARSPNHHLSFGFGEHFCLGAPLARIEARIAIEEFLARVKSYQRVDPGDVEWVEDFILRGPRRLDIEVVPR